jgi:hypothetical protein
MLRSFRRQLSRRRIEHLLREGVGVQQASWLASEPEADPAWLAAAIEEWVREAMGRMRRPNGIDQVALTLACRDRGGAIHCANNTGLLKPASFYAPAGAAAISGFLDDAATLPPERRWEIVGALVSLGDLAYALGAAA